MSVNLQNGNFMLITRIFVHLELRMQSHCVLMPKGRAKTVLLAALVLFLMVIALLVIKSKKILFLNCTQMSEIFSSTAHKTWIQLLLEWKRSI